MTVSVYWATDDEYLLVSIILQNLLSEVDQQFFSDPLRVCICGCRKLPSPIDNASRRHYWARTIAHFLMNVPFENFVFVRSPFRGSNLA